MNKTKVLEAMENLPEEFTTEELIERLLFIEKVEKGLHDMAEGKTVSLQEAKQRFLDKWEKQK